LISKYRFLAIPVMNDDKQLVGIITIDDIVEVIEEEVTEDIYQSSGINVNSDVGIDFGKSLINRFYDAYRARTPWLIITLLGQYFAATLIASFNMTIAAIPIAISFMPLLSGMSGNIGNQSSTIIIRGLATGEVEMNKGSKILFHEILISIMIGVTCAGIVGALSFYVYKNVLLSALIALSLIVSMMLAVGLGTITPMAFKKMDLDPAAASGPLITTGIDVLSFFVYLTLITKFISDLV
jgi:magnesium transporter